MEDFNIPIPEGYAIDTKESDLIKGIIRFKKTSILNWEDFVNEGSLKGYVKMEQFYDKYEKGKTEFSDITAPNALKDYAAFGGAIFSNIEKAKSITALIKLLLVRSVYVKDWKPDWEDETEDKYVIDHRGDNIRIIIHTTYKRILSFPTEEMAELFLDNNRNLLEEYFNF